MQVKKHFCKVKYKLKKLNLTLQKYENITLQVFMKLQIQPP